MILCLISNSPNLQRSAFNMNKSLFGRIACIALVSFSAISLAIASIAWFANAGGKTEKSADGSIGLRGYFYAGDGSEDHPYEIVSPIHLYNFSRLQNYGIFPEKSYFQIGHIFNQQDGYQCIDMETGDYVDYLDMDYFYSNDPSIYIRPIGSESTPFHGTLNGNGIPIKNLKISGYPEDIGVFGYVAYDGYIEGLVCDTIQVESLGYTKVTSDDTYKLFNIDIDDVFSQATYLTRDMNLDFYNYSNGSYVRALPVPARPGLKNENGVGGVEYTGVDTNIVTGSNDIDYYHGYFLPTYPNVANDPFTYSWSSSSPLITESNVLNLDLDNDGEADNLIMFDLSTLQENGQDKFNSGDDMQLDARLSLTASVTVDGIIYSRVIQSYLCEFYSHKAYYGDGAFTVSIYCNYATPTDSHHPATNYRHGNNIGFLVGHLDGTMKHSYVYNGTFKFNDDSYNPVKAETQVGLIGEVGTNVVNALDPDFNQTIHGDTGVMNFTRIYSGIRSNITSGQTIQVGKEYYKGDDVKYICYDAVKNTGTGSLFSEYAAYLRQTIGDNPHYITKYSGNLGSSWSTWQNYIVPNDVPPEFNTIDFIYNNLIQDEDDGNGNVVDRGLGVFKIVTPYNPNTDYANNLYDTMGDCQIVQGESFDKVYFSTAEYDHTVTGQLSWGNDSSTIKPLRATTLPSDTNVFSFDYPFSRDYNYVFEMDLTQNTSTSTNNFMYNTDSVFLTNYLKSRLIDKYGRSVTYGDYRFGFMFRSSENYTLNSLSSYMPIGKPGDMRTYGDGKKYPSNTIIFNIENDHGANVSVVGNGNNISIYKFDTNSSTAPTKLYTMKCENSIDVDSHRYFSYDYREGYNGATSNLAIPYADNMMGDGGCLYGHIFKLDKLPEGWAYAIASENDTKANIYYLAVQGQTDGTIGSAMAKVGNVLDDVDFLIAAPTKSDYVVTKTIENNEEITTITYNSSKVAEFNFTSEFNTTTGTVTVNAADVTVSATQYTLINIHYVNDPQFITYLFAYDYKDTPAFCINEAKYATNSSPTYTVIRRS